ncbi:UDP-glucosyltransferase 2 [Andrena cerasifolii]|uniref:UDP-glucosyltransferase 2 n=1 Tax=Andrena cerasifolii TaxID=2819439 RepID=UPI0040376165
MRLLLPVVLAALLCCSFANGLRILGVFPLNGKSHWVMAESLMTSLAKRGHQVDVVTHFPMKKPVPNYTDISVAGSLEAVVNNMLAENVTKFNAHNMQLMIQTAGVKTCNLLGLPNIQQLIKNPPNDPPYDVVIVELFVAPCFLAFGRHLNASLVGVITSDFHDWLRDKTGNPNNPSFIPSLFSDFVPRMTFWDRLRNTVLTNLVNIKVNYYVGAQSKMVKEHFGIDATIDDLYKDLALVLVNSHHSVNGVKPYSTGTIEVGGLHIKENGDPLSPEMQKWLDASKDGCIFFTFGSMVRIETFPKPLMETFYKVFEKIAPVRVLMKVAKKEDLLPGLPKNVMIQSWFPQVSVFKHKNTKAFITHGGLMGVHEAIYFGIPMIGIPLFGDQPTNLKNVANKKLGVNLGSVHNVTEETLTNAINLVLHDDTYRKSMRKVSEIYKDRPMSALQTAVFWVEYVGRHGKILQSAAVHLNWLQLNLVDVYGLLLGCAAAALYAVYYVLRTLKNQLIGCKSCSKRSSKPSQSKKNK